MKQTSSIAFKATIKIDPTWAFKLTEPLEITDHCDMDGSGITHLSPLLYFTAGSGYSGNSASFHRCKSLKTAEGTFSGYVDFSDSGVSELKNLNCGKNNDGSCASFHKCKSLRIAKGTFPGYVDFSDSGVRRIRNLTCGKDKLGNSASFYRCRFLELAEGTFSGCVDLSYSHVAKIGDLICSPNSKGIRLSATNCKNLARIPVKFHPKEIRANEELLKKLNMERLREASRRHLQSGIIEI